MEHVEYYNADYDLECLERADEIRNNPKRMDAIRNAAEEKVKLAKKFLAKETSPTSIEKGYTVI